MNAKLVFDVYKTNKNRRCLFCSVTYFAQKDRLHRSHVVGGLSFVSESSTTYASRLGSLHFSTAHRCSFHCGAGLVDLSSFCKVGHVCASGEIWSLQNSLSHLHRIGRKSLTLHVSRAQCAPIAGKSMVVVQSKEVIWAFDPLPPTTPSPNQCLRILYRSHHEHHRQCCLHRRGR